VIDAGKIELLISIEVTEQGGHADPFEHGTESPVAPAQEDGAACDEVSMTVAVHVTNDTAPRPTIGPQVRRWAESGAVRGEKQLQVSDLLSRLDDGHHHVDPPVPVDVGRGNDRCSRLLGKVQSCAERSARSSREDREPAPPSPEHEVRQTIMIEVDDVEARVGAIQLIPASGVETTEAIAEE